jgi:PhnB protein
MKLKTMPFLLFDGNCAEAMTFYQKCLGGELTLTKLKDSPMKDMFPADKQDRIINAYLKSGSIEISATDWMAAPEYLPRNGNVFAIFVLGKSYQEIRVIFNKLSKGHKADRYQPLHAMPFGMYGQFIDRFGYHWIFKSDLT